MKKSLLTLAITSAIAALSAPAALAQQAAAGTSLLPQAGDVVVRFRAVNLDIANKGHAATQNGVSVKDKTIPEVDISYFFTPNIAAELVLTYPQKHDVLVEGKTVGSLKHLPPTLLAQYHFTQFGQIKPYVGAGINYTRFSSVKLPGDLTVKKNSVGLALQAGVDYILDKNWSLNFDVKKVQIDTTISGDIGKFKVDPLLIGLGVGYRF